MRSASLRKVDRPQPPALRRRISYAEGLIVAKHMPSTNLNGPLKLRRSEIDRAVYSGTPGAYSLGDFDGGSFFPRYMGRSDEDLSARLKQWADIGSYAYFKFCCFRTVLEAYNKECRLYHDWGGDRGKLDNDVHPAKPPSKAWSCPVCGA